MRRQGIYALSVIFLAFFLVGCGAGMTAADHQRELPTTQDMQLTLGVFQSRVKVGMSQGDVIAAVGSPNIVTKDAEDVETLIWDKVASESAYSRSSSSVSGGLGVAAFPLPVAVGGAVGGSSSKSSGASASTQRTLTVVVKFEKNKVKSMTYNTSKF
ncbi:MAG: hypothetical protein WC831_00845 [Parcubacteria group bacterium]|jgi:hypothetical protein